MPGAESLFDKLASKLDGKERHSVSPPPPAPKESSKQVNSKGKAKEKVEKNGTGGGGGGEPVPAKKPAKNKKIEEIYQKKTQLEHILLRPDTYIGSVENVKESMWVVDDGKVDLREVHYVPGLYKIFDEILVNAADNKQRDPKMDCIKIDIDPENNKVSIWNNGLGIPVEMHSEEKMYVPTLIFGHLLTSSNFDDEEEKVTGGRNGYGAKLCNVFSTKFTVETANKKGKRAFKQSWQNNMSKAGEPKIKDYFGEDYTKITFEPDLPKFKMESLDKDIVSIFHRRAYDVAATSGCKVFLNGKRLPVKNFKDYVDMYLKERKDEAGNPIKFQYEKVNDRWEVACCLSENGFQQVSFVNSIATTKGGKHIDHVADNLVKSLSEAVKKKNKNGVEMKPSQIKNHLWLFVNALVVNPTFDSQTKEFMTLQATKFGSKCNPSEKFSQALVKSGIVEACVSWAKYKAEEKLGKMQKGTKKNKITGIPKLEDANEAGRVNSHKCTLILTEGDSAKTLAVAGLGVVGRDLYGVFPLRGKLLNVREASSKQIMDNAEISALVKILGLQYKKKYESGDDLKTLRYGKLMIMTDQDHDGSHIKGLIINFIHHNWPSLLKMNFIEEFITPIVKASKGKNSTSFFSMPELEEWKKNTPNWKTFKIKYYKGLGTSTSQEAKEYFSDMQRHRIKFKYDGKVDDDNIMMAFSKQCVQQRKDWLTTWMETTKTRREMGLGEEIIYNKDVHAITYTEFINKELVLFSNLDNSRSIPSLVDGLKPGQRKVLYTCLKRNDKKEVKVAQLAGSVAEHSAYHHGEQSLMSTIIGLAQNYVGSNNINVLQPIGQFGTRLQGGKDAASPRYIFTMLSPLAHNIFNAKDAPLLNTLFDDNLRIEPEYYVPLIPMVLVNGADGIGTGWMTKIPNFNPRDIVRNVRRMIEGQDPVPMKPWYKGFRGEIMELGPQRFACNGEVSILNYGKEIEITELPVSTWTQNYKESVMEAYSNGTDKQPALISDYKEYHTDTTVKFVVSMKEEQFRKHEDKGFHETFKLQSSINLSSMVLFDRMGCLRKYESVDEILREFFELRVEFYEKRREYMLGLLEAEASKLSNQARFILEKCDGKLTIENKKKKAMVAELISKGYDPDPVAVWKEQQKKLTLEEDEEEGTGEEEVEENQGDKKKKDGGNEVMDGPSRNYDYLLGMKLWSLTLESKERLLRDRDIKKKELEDLKKKTPSDLYRDDLDEFMTKLEEEEAKEAEDEAASGRKNKKAIAAQGKSKDGRGRVTKPIVAEYAPSPKGERVAPKLDEMMKKAEAANKARENKGKPGVRGRQKKVKEEAEEKDEFDMLLEDGNVSLREKLDSSTGSTEDVKPKPKGGKGGEKKVNGAAKKPRATKDGLKQTKLNFGKAGGKRKKKGSDSEDEPSDDDILTDSDSDIEEITRPKALATKKPPVVKLKKTASPPKRKRALSDSEDDFSSSPKKKASPKKRGGKKKKGSDSDEDIILDSDDESFAASAVRAAASERVKRTAAVQKKYVFDDDDDDEPFKSSGSED